jgi:hypothetical protein
MSKSQIIAACVAVALTVAGGAGSAFAGVQPVVLSPDFDEGSSEIVSSVAKDAPACTVEFTTLTDERHDQKTIGVVGRPIRSPADTQAWMRSILGGLAKRGIDPRFDATASAEDAPAAKVGLKVVWIAPVAVNFSANVIVSVDAAATNGKTLQKTYRGQVTTTNWNNGAGEIDKAIDKAFSDALNKIAPDLRELCTAQ